jgi:SMODS and SLOG-associating 2TM effector domain family 4
MFELSLFDHLRLTFGHIVYRQKAHLQVAHSRVAWSRGLRGAEALLMLGVAFTSLAAAYGRGSGYVIVSALLGAVALVVLLFQVTFDLDGSARAHRSAAARLWQIREQYRAVLSDLHDGAIDPAEARRRRDALTDAMREFLDQAPAVPPQPRQANEQGMAEEPVLSDAQIDGMLPESLRKAGRPATT